MVPSKYINAAVDTVRPAKYVDLPVAYVEAAFSGVRT